MSEVYLFKLASQRTQWLDARQQLIANNVANANTPGFQAKDLKAFSTVLNQTASEMTTTNPMHITPTALETSASIATPADSSETSISGNSVDIESEMIKLGDTGRDYNEANGIKKAFHQLLMAAIK